MHSGVVAEFETPEAFATAYVSLCDRGYTRLSSWTPYPVRSVVDRLPESRVAPIMLGAGATGAVVAYAIQWWCNAVDYPINVGGRPLNSVVAFIPITFETTVLFSAVAGFFATLALCGLPRLWHPLAEVDGSERITIDRFWLGVDASDPLFADAVEQDLVHLGALQCRRVGDASHAGERR
jgi:hypothetical protein